jgi:thioredoxin-related protein
MQVSAVIIIFGDSSNPRFCATAMLSLIMLFWHSALIAENSAAQLIEFDDTPLAQDIVLPDWFKLSFLELKNDIADLKETEKSGLIVYFGQKDCPYCKMHLDKNWGDRGIVQYTRTHFDVIAIDVRGQRPVADTSGKIYRTEKAFSVALNTNFTPTLVFYDLAGDEVLRLSGYHPPYQFKAALEYVADGHYKRESLRTYLRRGESISGFEESELNEHKVFSDPPYALDRTGFPADIPLAVFFESPTCHSCNVLHAGPMTDPQIVQQLQEMEVVQLDMTANTPVFTPGGGRLSAKQWAERLGLYYSPTIIFYDEHGKEIIRVDSVIRFYRLRNILEYILSKGYVEYPNFQSWRQKHQR